MAGASIQKGLSNLRRKLRKVPVELRADLERAVLDSANTIERGLATEAPVDEGDLRDTLKKKIGRDKLSFRVGWWEKGNKRNWKKGGWHAHFVIFGSRAHMSGGRPAGKLIPAIPANDFVGRVWTREKPAIRHRIRRGVIKALGSAVKG